MTQQILQSMLSRNAAVIAKQTSLVHYLKQDAKAYPEIAEDRYKIIRKIRTKLSHLVELQVRMKVELKAIYRNQRIVKKYTKLFGNPPTAQVALSIEQEAMLDALLAEKAKEDQKDLAKIA